MNSHRLGCYIVIGIMAAAAIFFGWKYWDTTQELRLWRLNTNIETHNQRALDFTSVFIKQVLKSDTEVNFDTRLKLENMVREIGDEKVLAQWQAFVNSPNESDAQRNVKELLDVLIDKVNKG